MATQSASETLLTPEVLRRAFSRFPSGVVAVCAAVDGRPHGLAASSFTSVSLDPPFVSVCVGTGSQTWPIIEGSPRLGVSVAGAGQGELYRRLAAKGVDRFAEAPWRSTPSGAVLLDGASAWFECELSRQIPAGDHVFVLLQVTCLQIFAGVEPLLFHDSRFRAIA